MAESVVSFTEEFGYAAPDLNWVPSPTHVLRRAAVLDVLQRRLLIAGPLEHPARALDMGCGAGTLLLDLARLGYRGKGVDVSEQARELAGHLHHAASSTAEIAAAASDGDLQSYDVLFAIEVLEHVPNDTAAVRQWAGYLKYGGRMIVSVPAHRRMWGASDEWAGHVRRYEREELEDLLESASLTVECVISYGFPLSNLLRPVSNAGSWWKARRRRRNEGDLKPEQATAASGVDRSVEKGLFSLYASRPFRRMFRACFSLQRRFYDSEIGTGYIAVAVRK